MSAAAGDRRRHGAVAALGLAQTLAWASTYYLPAIIAVPVANDLGVSVATVFAAFSLALVVSALLGPKAGHAIDRLGGRPVLMGTNVVFASGLALLGAAQGVTGLFLAWALIGAGMGAGLYEAAFAALVRLFGVASRSPITGVTLFAGFASTIGWPLTAWIVTHAGWREACFAWAALHLVVGLPLNWSLHAPHPTRAVRQSLRCRERQQHLSARLSCCRSCSRPPGSSALRWRHTCLACYRRAARPWRRRSPWAR